MAVRDAGYRGAYLGRMGGEHASEEHGHVYAMFKPERVRKSGKVDKLGPDRTRAESIIPEEVLKSEDDLTVDSLMSGDRGQFSMLSAEKKELSKEENATRTQSLANDLYQHGYESHPIKGKYEGTKENSFIVFNSDHRKMNALASKYQQDSVAHSNGHLHELHYLGGKDNQDKIGKHRKANTYSLLAGDEDDNWSQIKGQKFRMNFDWNKLHEDTDMH
jgi:hypothetical protein